jgi:hypothetical protein
VPPLLIVVLTAVPESISVPPALIRVPSTVPLRSTLTTPAFLMVVSAETTPPLATSSVPLPWTI